MIILIFHFQVTFKDPDAAMRACQNPSPTIDGRRANCNLASLGAQKTRPPTPQHGFLSLFFFLIVLVLVEMSFPYLNTNSLCIS